MLYRIVIRKATPTELKKMPGLPFIAVIFREGSKPLKFEFSTMVRAIHFLSDIYG